ncbi:MAG: glycosyltransferase [Desulfobulbaceae bacterium]|nr:glycosyltransferase [Desulfobulbaceae bacterium]
MSVDYSVVIPAFNEEALLGETIAHLREAMGTVSLTGEIIVANNNSTDRTAEIAEKAGATVVFEPINQISRARNAGARVAKGRYLIFVDADTVVSPALLQKALDNLESGRCCGGGANIAPLEKVPFLARLVLGYWNIVSSVLRLAAGCFVYARRDDFDACGGFSEKFYATEEIWFSMALRKVAFKHRRGFRIIRKPKVVTSSRKLVWFNHWYQLILLILVGIFPYITRFKWVCDYWYKRPEHLSDKPE